MAKNEGRKREEVLVTLLNYARLKMDLLAVGREDAEGKFPNAETGFVLRKWIMQKNHHGQMLEIAIPRHCAMRLRNGLDSVVDAEMPARPVFIADAEKMPARIQGAV